MVNRLDDHTRNTPSRTAFILNPAESFLEQLVKKPGATLLEKVEALNSRARELLTPILAKLDMLSSEEKPALMDELNAAIVKLDREPNDGIEDGHYGEIRRFADSRYDGAPMED